MDLIKQLRERTGAGIADCKVALEEAGGDLQAAADVLRKKGVAKAAKRADREAAEGLIIAGTDDAHTEGYLIEVNSETDFVSRNDQFRGFANQLFELVKAEKPAGREALLGLALDGSTVQEKIDLMTGTIGEKIDVKNVAVMAIDGGVVQSYIHGDGRIGVLIALSGTADAELARDIAMQIAAANPRYITSDEVSAEDIEKEKDVYREQLKNEGKPEEMIEKIIGGKLGKFYEEICLVEQVFIKDDKKKVKDVLGGAKVESFVRFALG